MTAKKFAAGQTVDGRTICGARKKNGEPCGAHPARGATRCRRHGGGSPQAKRKATERVVEQKAAAQLRNLGYDEDAPNIDPTEALLRLVSDKAREVAWLRHMVDQITSGTDIGALSSDPLVWGVTQHEYGMTAEGPVDKHVEAAQQNIWWQLLHKAEDQLARYAKAALDAGVQQKQVEIRQTEALAFVGALNQIFTLLQLTTDQQKRVPEIVPQVLRTLEQQAPA